MGRLALTNVYCLSMWRACGYTNEGERNGETPLPLDRFGLSIHERKARKLRGGPPPSSRAWWVQLEDERVTRSGGRADG